MKKDRLSVFILGLILLFATLIQLKSLKFLLPDFGIEDEMVVLEGYEQLVYFGLKDFSFFKYPAFIVFILVLIVYPLNLLYNIRTVIHLEGFSDLKAIFFHPVLSEEVVLYSGRISSLIAGILSIWLFYVLFRRMVNVRAVLLGSLFFLSFPSFLFASSVFKSDSFLLVSLLVVFAGCFQILEKGRIRDYMLAGFGFGLCLAFKLNIFAIVPLIYSHRLRFKSLSFARAILKKELGLSILVGFLMFFILSPLQFLHPVRGFYALGLELLLQARVHPLFKASPLLWYQKPVFFQLLCVFPFVFGMIGYLLSIPGFVFARGVFGREHFRLFISYPVVFFLGWALISKLGYPHLYVPLLPFFAISAGIFTDRLFRGGFFLKISAVVLLIMTVATNIWGFRDLNLAQERIVYESLNESKDFIKNNEKIVCFFPYRPLRNSDYHLDYDFLPQFMLTDDWFMKNHPQGVLVHQTYYFSYSDNPEIQNAERDGFFNLREGRSGYRLEREWGSEPGFVRIYKYLLADLNNLSVGLYRR